MNAKTWLILGIAWDNETKKKYYRFLHQGKPKSLLRNSCEFYVLPIKGTGIVGDKFPHPPYDMIMSAVLCDINNQPALNQWKANNICM